MKTTKTRTENQGRRDVLRAGAVAVGAALLPRTTAAEQIGTAAPDYHRRIAEIAEELRLGFRAGEFRGFTDEDDRRWDAEDGFTPPLLRLEEEIAQRLLGHVPDDDQDVEEDATRRACWALMHSPSTGAAIFGGSGGSIEQLATEAAARDVLRIARERRWYTPARDEYPSNEDLGVRS